MKTGRRRKRWLAVCLTGVLVMMLSATVFATGSTPAPPTNSSETDAGKGSITIDNPIKGKTYSAYKIFDVTYTAGGTSYGYSIKGDSAWYDVVKSFGDVPANGLTLTKAAGANEYSVSIAESTFSAADFAKHLSDNVGSISADYTLGPLADGAAEGSVLKQENMTLGYYFVKGNSGALCNLTTTNPAVTIHDKNDVPFEKTVADDADTTKPDKDGVQVGQVLTYTIKGIVPDTSGFETYIYRASDIMDEGLTFNKDVKVTVGGTEITLNSVADDASLTGDAIRYIDAGTYTYPAGHDPVSKESGGGFKLTLDVKNRTFNAPIVITYTATVNEKAVQVISENEAILDYGNDPDDLMDSTPQVVKTFSSKIVIDKYKKVADAADMSNKLAGAKFVLKRGTGADAEYYKGTFTGGGTDPENLTKVEWVKSADAADGKPSVPDIATSGITEVETDANGAAVFAGLKNGTYYLVETEAPAGYNLLADPEEVTVNASITDAVPPVLENGSVTVSIANSDGSFLPSTGGIGTTIFYVLGLILLLSAVVWFVVRKRADRQ